MGAIWYKTDDGWKQTIPYGRAANGWAKSPKGYRKTSSTVWTDLFTTDLTPPAVPTIVSVTVSSDLSVNQGRLSITVKAPATADVSVIRVKVGKAVSANNDTDANYVATQDGTGYPWSEWHVVPNQTVTKTWPMSGNLTNGATYYVTAWAMDKTRNYSAPVNKSVVYKTPAVLTAKEYTGYIVPTDSSTIQKSDNKWLTGDKFVRTGGPYNYHGLWFYSTKLSAALKGVLGIEKMILEIQRYPGNLKGTTRFHIFSHKLENRPAGSIWSPNNVVATLSTWYSIEQGQTIKITLPSAWHAAVIAGTVKGFGIYAQTSSANDQYNNTMYGFGTYSGRIYSEWRK